MVGLVENPMNFLSSLPATTDDPASETGDPAAETGGPVAKAGGPAATTGDSSAQDAMQGMFYFQPKIMIAHFILHRENGIASYVAFPKAQPEGHGRICIFILRQFLTRRWRPQWRPSRW